MMIELTTEQSSTLQSGQPVPCVLDRTECIVIRKDIFERLQPVVYDDSDWTLEEMRALAARAFDDADRAEAIE